MKCAMAVACLCFAMGCGGSPAIDAAPATPSQQQVAAAAELAKQRNEIAEERASLERERQAFLAEQNAANQKAAAIAEQIKTATAEYEAATKKYESIRARHESALAGDEAQRKYREDLARLGAMSHLERMRVGGAAAALKAGNANNDQLNMLLPFNEYRDNVIDALARIGKAAGILTPPK